MENKRLTEKVNYGSSWVETIETDEYIPLNYSTDTMTGKCIDKLGKLEDLMEKYGIESIEELEDTIQVKKALELVFGKHKG